MEIVSGNLIKVEASDVVNGTIVIPPEVKNIACYAFSSTNLNLTHIEIPDHVTNISKNAFANCTSLKTVKLPKNLKSLPESVFENCTSLESIDIPESVTFIGAAAFANCCSLKSITIPRFVTEIYLSMFKGCTSLEDVKINGNIYSIYPNAFENCKSLKSINLPKSLKTISNYAFLGCESLENLQLPERLDKINSYAFANCSSLKTINIPSSVREIHSNSFENCTSLEEISIPESVEQIGDYVFLNCSSLKKAEIKNRNFGQGQFTRCTSLESVLVSNPIYKLSDSAFESCYALENIDLSNFNIIGKSAFMGCKSLKTINLDGVDTIQKQAFFNCDKLDGVNIPDSVSTIDQNAFGNCESLSFLHIPKTVKLMERMSNNSLLFFNKTENGFNLSSNQTSESIPLVHINLDYTFLSNHWNKKDILLREQRNESIADFYNELISTLPEEKIEEFIENHNFTFFKQLKLLNPTSGYKNIYKALYNLGAVQTPIDRNGKRVDYAQKVVGFIIEKTTKDPKFIFNLSKILSDMELQGFKPDFTDFFLSNFDKLMEEEKISKGFICKAYNMFEDVQKTNTSNRGSQRQLKPTVEKFKSYFVAQKFNGVNEETKEIAETISRYFLEQSTFNRAVQIDQERTKKRINDNILKKQLREGDVFKTIDDYDKALVGEQRKILGVLVDVASNEFSFEWLQKNDPCNFILGKLCDCCAHLEGAGHGIMHASIVHPYVQNLVIKNKNGEIVAKSTLFINKHGRYGVCNNVEVKKGIESLNDMMQIYQKFVLGIREFVKEYNKQHPLLKLKQVNVGMDHNDLRSTITLFRKPAKHLLKAINYKHYGYDGNYYNGDSHDEQYIIWSAEEDKKLARYPSPKKVNPTENERL